MQTQPDRINSWVSLGKFVGSVLVGSVVIGWSVQAFVGGLASQVSVMDRYGTAYSREREKAAEQRFSAIDDRLARIESNVMVIRDRIERSK